MRSQTPALSPFIVMHTQMPMQKFQNAEFVQKSNIYITTTILGILVLLHALAVSQSRPSAP